MVTIRLARGGANKRPYYRIEVADRRRAPNGKCIERVGFYNPKAAASEEALRVNMERVQYWLGNGAKPTERVADLLKKVRSTSPASS
ncbi:MAG: 30S ribosomal protein S16 [Sulfurifustaceae bacterium]|jgi:small subunit ribosomal protein S16